MDRETIQDLLTRQPFEPFFVRTSRGEVYEVRHPEMAILMKAKLIVALPSDSPSEPPSRATTLSLLHITSIEGAGAA